VVTRTVKWLGTALVFLLLAAPFTADAQPRGKVYRTGFIQTAAPNEMEHLTKAFEEVLHRVCRFRSWCGRAMGAVLCEVSAPAGRTATR
jgi:hypothetical protein